MGSEHPQLGGLLFECALQSFNRMTSQIASTPAGWNFHRAERLILSDGKHKKGFPVCEKYRNRRCGNLKRLRCEGKPASTRSATGRKHAPSTSSNPRQPMKNNKGKTKTIKAQSALPNNTRCQGENTRRLKHDCSTGSCFFGDQPPLPPTQSPLPPPNPTPPPPPSHPTHTHPVPFATGPGLHSFQVASVQPRIQ